MRRFGAGAGMRGAARARARGAGLAAGAARATQVRRPSPGALGAGLGAAGLSLLAAGQADAATQEVVGQLADGRTGALLAIVLPALGWVTWNIAGPGLNQLDQMKAKNDAQSRRSR